MRRLAFYIFLCRPQTVWRETTFDYAITNRQAPLYDSMFSSPCRFKALQNLKKKFNRSGCHARGIVSGTFIVRPTDDESSTGYGRFH